MLTKNEARKTASLQIQIKIRALQVQLAALRNARQHANEDSDYAYYVLEYLNRVNPWTYDLHSGVDGRNLGYYGPMMDYEEFQKTIEWGNDIKKRFAEFSERNIGYNSKEYQDLIDECSIYEYKILA